MMKTSYQKIELNINGMKLTERTWSNSGRMRYPSGRMEGAGVIH